MQGTFCTTARTLDRTRSLCPPSVMLYASSFKFPVHKFSTASVSTSLAGGALGSHSKGDHIIGCFPSSPLTISTTCNGGDGGGMSERMTPSYSHPNRGRYMNHACMHRIRVDRTPHHSPCTYLVNPPPKRRTFPSAVNGEVLFLCPRCNFRVGSPTRGMAFVATDKDTGVWKELTEICPQFPDKL